MKLIPDMGNTGSVNGFHSSLGQSSYINAHNISKEMWRGWYMGFVSVTTVYKKQNANELHYDVIYRMVFKYITLNACMSLTHCVTILCFPLFLNGKIMTNCTSC
jgi:hypothetical protein